MNRILHWLTVKLSHSTSTGATEERSISEEYNPDESVMSSDLQTNIDDLMPDIDGEGTDDTQSDGDTQPNIEIIKDPSRASEMSESFDPYNSGSFKVPKK